MLCTSCLFPNSLDTTWCKQCGAPISATATIAMPDAVRTVGFVYRGALHGRPKPSVILGMWLIFFPGLIGNALALLLVLSGCLGGVSGFVAFWFSIAGGSICTLMLYRVTKNYLTIPKKKPD
jgi:hypothetical protein